MEMKEKPPSDKTWTLISFINKQKKVGNNFNLFQKES